MATLSTDLIVLLLLLLGRPADGHEENSAGFSKAEEAAVRDVVSRIFPEAETTIVKELTIPPEEQKAVRDGCPEGMSDSVLTVFIPQRKDSVLGYSVLDNVRGKDQFITYLLTLSNRLEIRNLEIIAYRESYGSEIRNRSWLDQFNGKHPGERMTAGREIRNISGATISVRSVTAGVRRILCTLQFLRNSLPGVSG